MLKDINSNKHNTLSGCFFNLVFKTFNKELIQI